VRSRSCQDFSGSSRVIRVIAVPTAEAQQCLGVVNRSSINSPLELRERDPALLRLCVVRDAVGAWVVPGWLGARGDRICIVTFGCERMNSRVIIGSWKITEPLYVPLRNVVVNFLGMVRT
jgi:hypothetical protein